MSKTDRNKSILRSFAILFPFRRMLYRLAASLLVSKHLNVWSSSSGCRLKQCAKMLYSMEEFMFIRNEWRDWEQPRLGQKLNGKCSPNPFGEWQNKLYWLNSETQKLFLIYLNWSIFCDLFWLTDIRDLIFLWYWFHVCFTNIWLSSISVSLHLKLLTIFCNHI